MADAPNVPHGSVEVLLEWEGFAPGFLLVPRKLYETETEAFAGFKATYMEPLRG